MSKSIDRLIFEKLIKIAENPDASILLSVAQQIFEHELPQMIQNNVLKYSGVLGNVQVFDKGDLDYFEVQRNDGKNMYFSPSDGWVAISDEDIALYKVDLDWIVREVMFALEINDRHLKEIHRDYIWALGECRVERQKIPIVIVRNIKKDFILDALLSYLNKSHLAKNPALVIALDLNIPSHLSLPSQNELMSINDVMKWDKPNFEINTQLLVQRIRGTVSADGFMNSFRTLRLRGETYKFSKLQADAVEYMYKKGVAIAIHQHEILAEIESSQKRLQQLFRSKGRDHSAWGVVIQGDGRGNFWLEM
jgi:hypothetical protein